MQFVSGHIPGQESYVRHTWPVANGAVVDLTADLFGQPSVVVGADTPFHASLDEREEGGAAEIIASLPEGEMLRCERLLGAIEERMPGVAR
jgi:hypothetical protein